MYKLDWDKYINFKRLRLSDKEKARLDNRDDYIDKRIPFESDFGRVVFSSAARRMHDKTQVFPLNTDDNIHTRLTHSIEVMNIGYSIGVSLTRNKNFIDIYDNANELSWQICSILKAACFIHDIGNPPFGHFGEDAIKTYFDRCFNNFTVENNNLHLGNGQVIKGMSPKDFSDFSKFLASDEVYDFTQFDGNAEGFRIITKLQFLDDLYGLNLSYPTLAAYLKYPNTGTKDKRDNHPISNSKHGVFYTENDYLCEIANGCSLMTDNYIKRHPLSYLVEAADSICYLSMDIEDSMSKKWHNLDSIKNNVDSETVKKIIEDIQQKAIKNKVPEKKQFVDFRVKLIDYLIDLAVKNFINHLQEIDKGTYNKELITDDKNNVATQLVEFCKKYIFSSREIVKLELAGDSIIKGLLDNYMYLLLHPEKEYVNRGRTTIPNSIVNVAIKEYYKDMKQEEETDALKDFELSSLPLNYRFRIIRDHIAMMTDKYAMNLNKELNGQRL